jgi:hypothetical protein
MRIRVAGFVSALSICLLTACGVHAENLPTSANSGDCVASIRFLGVVYVANMHVDQAAPKGRAIGPGAVMDCDHRRVVDRVLVSTVKGADSRQAIGVRGRWSGVYVAGDLPRTQWPSVVRST